MQISFKGYQAAPLNHVYINKDFCHDFIDELKEITGQEGIAIGYIDHDCQGGQWVQDHRIISERDNKPYCIAQDYTDDELFSSFLHKNYMEGEKTDLKIQGGNTFIGKFQDGKKWMMIGSEPKIEPDRLPKISSLYGIPPENIFIVPSLNFHLDMAIRPLNETNVLVNDFNMVKELLPFLDDNSEEFSKYKERTLEYISYLERTYHSADEVCEKLKSYGFNPIRVPGVWGREVNFMNAIVNQHENGTLSYITNSSKCSVPFYSKMQNYFEQSLKSQVSNISKIYYIQGKYIHSNSIEDYKKINTFMFMLKYLYGGIYCIALEEPDFEAWA